MNVPTSILCPVDFSESSRGALRYAALAAARFGARLTLAAVDDPLLHEAAELAAGPDRLAEGTQRELERFFRDTFRTRPDGLTDVRVEVATGKPAPEILRISREREADVIVMASHGATGFRKLFFGSTTERVLRETTVPVLVTPGSDSGPAKVEDVLKTVRRVLVPVDLTAATTHQLQTGAGLAATLGLPLVLLHVIEPVRSLIGSQARLPKVEAERRDRAERELEQSIADLSLPIRPEALVTYGEPAEEIAKVAQDRDVGLIVMGLHSSPVLGPRMGSVTYRVLCLAHRLVLALPPQPAPAKRLAFPESAQQTQPI